MKKNFFFVKFLGPISYEGMLLQGLKVRLSRRVSDLARDHDHQADNDDQGWQAEADNDHQSDHKRHGLDGRRAQTNRERPRGESRLLVEVAVLLVALQAERHIHGLELLATAEQRSRNARGHFLIAAQIVLVSNGAVLEDLWRGKVEDRLPLQVIVHAAIRVGDVRIVELERARGVLVVDGAQARLGDRVVFGQVDDIHAEFGHVEDGLDVVDDELDRGALWLQEQMRQVNVTLVTARVSHLDSEGTIRVRVATLEHTAHIAGRVELLPHKTIRPVLTGLVGRHLGHVGLAVLVVELKDGGDLVAGRFVNGLRECDRVVHERDVIRQKIRPVDVQLGRRVGLEDHDGE